MALMNLLPKEEKFYVMIDDLAKVATQTSDYLVQMVETDDEAQRFRFSQCIREQKDKAKIQLAEMNSEVCRTFITPFDREDLQGFGSKLYQIPKLIDKAQNRMLTHKLQPFNGDFNRLTDLIKAQTGVLEEIVYYLKKGRKIKEIEENVAQIHDLEDQGDQILGQLIAESFYSIQDVRELILRKDIYEMLEHVTDYYRDCANLALQIVLKHS